MIVNAKKTAISGEIEDVYFRCTQCGEYRIFSTRYGVEADILKKEELIALVLAGKIQVVDRKCDKCFAVSYSVYTPEENDNG